MLEQIQPVKSGIQGGELLHALDGPGVMVVLPQADAEVVLRRAVSEDVTGDRIQQIFVMLPVGLPVAVAVQSDTAEMTDDRGVRLVAVRVERAGPYLRRHVDAEQA